MCTADWSEWLLISLCLERAVIVKLEVLVRLGLVLFLCVFVLFYWLVLESEE
jgi:hypothetical protein